MVGRMAAVGKGPHFLQKNLPIEFFGYGPDCCIKFVSNGTKTLTLK